MQLTVTLREPNLPLQLPRLLTEISVLVEKLKAQLQDGESPVFGTPSFTDIVCCSVGSPKPQMLEFFKVLADAGMVVTLREVRKGCVLKASALGDS